MPKFDPNLIAARTLRRCLQRHTSAEQERHAAMMRAWREARATAKKQPAPRVKLGPRVQYPKLSPEELARVGGLPLIID